MQSEHLEEENLEEEEYPVVDNELAEPTLKWLLLSEYPDNERSLSDWLAQAHSLDDYLLVLVQVCQFFRYVHQHGWCFAHFLPEFIQLSKPIRFYDLTGAYAVEEPINFGLQGHYCAPELSYGKVVGHESLSSYAIGALLYQMRYQEYVPLHQSEPLDLKPIPRIYQLLKTCLSPIPEERFPLSQLLDLLIDVRRQLKADEISWEVAQRTSVGQSL